MKESILLSTTNSAAVEHLHDSTIAGTPHQTERWKSLARKRRVNAPEGLTI
jgi:hypothetical protein